MPVSSKEFLEIQATIECRFTLKPIYDMTITYSQMHHTHKYSQHRSIIWPVWLNSWVFVYKLSGCGFQSHCCHLNFRYYTCFKQGVPWHSGNYGVWIHFEKSIWHDNNIQSTRIYSTGGWVTWPFSSSFLVVRITPGILLFIIFGSTCPIKLKLNLIHPRSMIAISDTCYVWLLRYLYITIRHGVFTLLAQGL